MKFARTALLGLAAAAVASSVVFAGGHANVEGAVKARKAHMQLFAYNLGILGNMAKGAVEFDADAAMRAAVSLDVLAKMDTTDYWVEGSSAADIPNTDAKAELWENIPDVIKIVGDMQTATAAMVDAAGSLDGVRGAIGPVGATCGACHKPYRN